ncbi:hypothetical protein M422DRAFT_48089 [Sphaerobolus stellatus SS14]|uniref:Uncharacterized protein n=1 Tax=Sphaerobolus stellatus (strain SS14) TaxID=990650 RepID=A0A0C9V6J2_SPHS4|nr:hypothetical protein M422DRAFT_48089 [Sphaerobolus stellatus SS14]
MIILGSPEKPFHLTGKLTLRRGAIIKDYSDQIGQLYCTVDETSNSNVTILINSHDGRGWDLQDTPRYVNDIITEVLKAPSSLDLDTDIFNIGCNKFETIFSRRLKWFG